jgi:hypothetical protein
MTRSRTVLAALGLALAASARAEMTAEELAKAVQNPVANLISVPFQNNTNFNYGPRDGTQNVLNIQPVIPIAVDPEWNVITRTIIPIVTQPGFVPGESTTTGLGDVQFSSPARAPPPAWATCSSRPSSRPTGRTA